MHLIHLQHPPSSGFPPESMARGGSLLQRYMDQFFSGISTAAGSESVRESLGLTMGSEQHARYLVENGPKDPQGFLQYELNIGADAHREEHGNPYWTQVGNEAAQHSDVSWDRNALADIDDLLVAPFHRLLLLAPWNKVGGYGTYGRWPMRSGVLEIRGSTATGMVKPILFPPPDSEYPTGAMINSEFPNPLAACSGYAFPVGLPVTIQLGAFVRVGLQSGSIKDETQGRQVESCGFDARIYPDAYGKGVLLGYGAVVLIPRHPLIPGHAYRVTIATHKHNYNWTFRVQGHSRLRQARVRNQ
jgi:hypothetical protein